MPKKLRNPLALSGGIDQPQTATEVGREEHVDTTTVEPRRKLRFDHSHTQEACCVGRCIVNDALPQWDAATPCGNEATDDIALEGFLDVPDGYTLHLCKPHSAEFRSGYKRGESLN